MKKLNMLCVALLILILLSGCNEVDRVSQNLSQEADNFNVVRQLTVINCIQGDVLFQMTGKMSIQIDSVENQLEIMVEDEHGDYQKHFVGLSDNVTYTVEQLRSKDVSQYRYTLNYNPKMWLPVEFDVVD